MEDERQAAYEAQKARIQAELPDVQEAEKKELKAKRQAWGVLGWIKRGRAKNGDARDLVNHIDRLNRMARNPGWSL